MGHPDSAGQATRHRVPPPGVLRWSPTAFQVVLTECDGVVDTTLCAFELWGVAEARTTRSPRPLRGETS